MGRSCCINFFCDFKVSDWIAIIGILINGMLGVAIVIFLQSKLTNKRLLKDHFINEVKDLRKEYAIYFKTLSGISPKEVVSILKSINRKGSDLVAILNKKYKIDEKVFTPFHIELSDILTEDPEFIKNYHEKNIVLSAEGSRSLRKFQNENSGLFNAIIIGINDFR
jgi:uncharacterized protein YneF (UPF0154 family)